MKTNNCSLILLLAVMGAAMLSSCEKAILEEEKAEKTPDEGNVVLRIAGFRQVPFDTPATKAVVDLATYCTRLNFVVYKDGTKVESVSQKKEDSNFGEVTMSLSPGTYKILALAHSSTGGNPTLSDPEKIQFTNALGYSDTFSYYGDIEVGNERKAHDVLLNRNVSCLRFTVSDPAPADAEWMHFHYMGGSGVLNAVTGMGGTVNSKQEKWVNLKDYPTPLTFNLYTFLQQETANLQVTVKALAADKESVLLERTFTDVPMKHQMVTEYSGSFFDSGYGFGLKAETDWGEPYYQTEY